MNFKYMDKEAWLLDDDILLKGTVKRKWFKHIFIPNSFGCGFGYQYVYRKDIGTILFRNDVHIVYAGLGHLQRVYGDYVNESQLEDTVQKVRNATGKEPIILGKRK
jgi:hypothetical protein